MHVLSGSRFEIGGEYNPTPRDVAIGLSRIPRWAGATLVPWSVLQHSLVVLHGVASIPKIGPDYKLYALWHDAEEMGTGDIPKPFKHPEQAKLGERLLRQLYEGSLGLPVPDEDVRTLVKLFDTKTKIAEVHTFCHPRAREDFLGLNCDFDLVDEVWLLHDEPVKDLIERFRDETERLLLEIGRIRNGTR